MFSWNLVNLIMVNGSQVLTVTHVTHPDLLIHLTHDSLSALL